MIYRRFFILFLALNVPSLGATKVTLNDAFKSGITKNEIVAQGREQIAQADARISQVTGGVLPDIGFNAVHTIQQAPSDPIAASFSPQNQTTAYFSLSQPLFRGLREWNGLSQLEHTKAAVEANQEATLNRLYREIAGTYFQVLTLEQDLKNLGDQSALYEKRVKDLTSRVKRGESNQTDAVTAESTQASLLAEIRFIEGQLEVARENFAFLTGLPPESEFADPDLLKSIKFEKLDAYLQKVEQRPDVKSALERYTAADKAVSVAWGAHSPTLDLVGNYYVKRPGFLSDIKWDVGLRLTVPLFQGGATQAKVTEAVSVRKEAELMLERTRRAARQEVKSLHRRTAARLEQLRNLQKSADLSKKNTTYLERDYRRGLARNIDVQLALTESRITQRTFDQAYFASQLDVFELQVATNLAATQEKE